MDTALIMHGLYWAFCAGCALAFCSFWFGKKKP